MRYARERERQIAREPEKAVEKVTPCVSAARDARSSKRKSMRYIAAEVEQYAHGRTYEQQNVGTGASYGLDPTKILYCYHLYRFDRFYLDQFVTVPILIAPFTVTFPLTPCFSSCFVVCLITFIITYKQSSTLFQLIVQLIYTIFQIKYQQKRKRERNNFFL